MHARAAVAVVAALLATACPSARSGPDATPSVPGDPPRGGRTAAVSSRVPPDRACGEPGPRPTPLPEAAASGLTRVGAGTVRPGETARFGTVSVEYQTSAWIGTMEVGHRGPALVLLIDQREAGGGPWGAQDELGSRRAWRTTVGPYRFDVHAAEGSPPASVSVEVAREACPASHVAAGTDAPAWLWVSSEAIRLQTLELPAGMLQIGLESSPPAPRLDVEYASYHHRFEPRAGDTWTLRAGDRLVTLEEVVRGATPSGGSAVHARVRIEPAPAREWTTAPGPVTGCGDPAPTPTPLPPELAAVPRVQADGEVALGGSRALGDLQVRYTAGELPGIGREPPQPIANLEVRAGTTLWGGPLSFGIGGPSQRAVREGRGLLRIDAPDGAPPARLRLRTATLPCAKTLGVAVPVPDATATFVWLSTLGHGTVLVGPSDRPVLTLQVLDGVEEPTLMLGSENASYTHLVAPELAGRSFTLDGMRVDLVEVRSTGDARREGTRWRTSGLVPALHVLLRVSR